MSCRCVVLLLACLFPALSHAWWNEEWTERKVITIDTGPMAGNLTAPLENATVLLRLHQGNFPGFLTVREGGADFRLIAGDDATPLEYFIERFDPVTQIALVWVRLPVLNPQSATEKLYLYFGNPMATDAGSQSGTFDANTVAAFHFDAFTDLPTDSSAAGTLISAGEVFPNPASIIGAGATLPGTSAMVIADAGSLAFVPEQGWSFSTWLRIGASPAGEAVVMQRPGDAGALSLVVRGTELVARFGETEVVATAPFTPAAWHHVAVTLAGTQLDLYLDGELAGSAPVDASLAVSGPVYVGGNASGTGLAPMDLDELRISNVARTAEWFRFENAISGERNDALVTYASAEAGEAGEGAAEGGHGGGGHFATIWYSVFGPGGPMVERVVIIICGVMMVVALAVIFFKTIMLSGARGATNRFEKAYAKLAIGATEPETQFGALAGKDKRYGASPLYNVYKTAVEQVASRQGSPSVGASAAGLDAKTIKSIQATMDSTMVRQSQRLNSYMVLLTIAISGGPFIGLLGTVVGVMTTFGAIAATGDINITAIAPGMAAALLATVAGLGVAIPALFGYNYLGSKVKELSADMSVFSDALTARITEEFGA